MIKRRRDGWGMSHYAGEERYIYGFGGENLRKGYYL
jgi:hypothetical protein